MYSTVVKDVESAKEFIELNQLDKTATDYFLIVVWDEGEQDR